MKTFGSSVPIVLINRDQRSDRLVEVTRHLNALGLDFIRVPAAEPALTHASTGSPRWFNSAVEVAIAQSHVKAWSEISNWDAEYAIVLEDDVRFAAGIDWPAALWELAQQAHQIGIGILQVGHLSFGLKGRLKYALAEVLPRSTRRGRARRVERIRLQGREIRVKVGAFRAGAHCYLISRSAAAELSQEATVRLFPVDGLLARLAPHEFLRGGLLIGHVSRSLAHQGLNPKVPAPDSDNIR